VGSIELFLLSIFPSDKRKLGLESSMSGVNEKFILTVLPVIQITGDVLSNL